MAVLLANLKLQMVPPTCNPAFLGAAAGEGSSALHIHACLADKPATGVLQHILLHRKNSPRGFEQGCARQEEEEKEGVQKPTA